MREPKDRSQNAIKPLLKVPLILGNPMSRFDELEAAEALLLVELWGPILSRSDLAGVQGLGFRIMTWLEP